MKSNNLYVISASDRYNYGDLIFNHIIDYYVNVEIKNQYNIIYVGLIGNDMRNYGGHITLGIHKLLSEVKPNDVLIFMGGGLLGHKWLNMYKQYCNSFLINTLQKTLGGKILEILVKRIIFKTEIQFPYTINKDDLKCDVKIIYNAVGGGALEGISSYELTKIVDRLKKTDYLSVRDNSIFNSLNKDKINIHLSPDSAILFSDIYNKEVLNDHISKFVKNKIKESEYIVLHFNMKIAKLYFEDLKILIKELQKITEYKIHFLPLDHIGNLDFKAQKLFRTDNSRFHFWDESLNIFEITSIIANSKLLIGSSLHSNVISASYGVPHLGLTKLISKVNSFFQTWYENSIFNSYDIDDLLLIIPQILDKKDFIEEHSIKLKAIAKLNMININNCILK